MAKKDEVGNVKPNTPEQDFDFAGEGIEGGGVSFSDFSLITLVQSSTPEAQEGVEGYTPGTLIDSATREILGKKMNLVVYKIWMGRCHMPPREVGTIPTCFSVDGVRGSNPENGTYCDARCPKYAFGKGNYCRDQVCMLVAPLENPSKLMRLVFWKTNSSIGKTLRKEIASFGKRNQAPIYGLHIELTAEKFKDEKQQSIYFKFHPEIVGLIPKEQWYSLRDVYLEVEDIRKEIVETFYTRLQANAQSVGKPEEAGSPVAPAPVDAPEAIEYKDEASEVFGEGLTL